MEDSYCKLLKLSNGDDIIAYTDNNCDNFKKLNSIFVCYPMLIKTIRMMENNNIIETFTIQPWIRIAKDDIIEIPTESIMVAVDVDNNALEQYKQFVDDVKAGNNTQNTFDTGLLEDEYIDEYSEFLESEDDIDGNHEEKKRTTFH